MRYAASKKVSWFMILILLFTWSGLPQYPPLFAQEQASNDYRMAIDNLRSLIDPSYLDPEALHQKLGDDIRTLAAYVQNNIRFEPYVGALRGAKGALLARAGNSVDRALLLADLLHRVGHNIRFAQAKLSYESAEQLVRISAAQPNRNLSVFNPALQQLLENAEAHFLFLNAALYHAGFEPLDNTKQAWREAVETARDYYWVQVNKDDQWIDADSTPGVKFGDVLVKPEKDFGELPDNLFYSVKFDLEIESVRNGETQQRAILQYAATTAVLSGVALGLYHTVHPNEIKAHLLIGEKPIDGDTFSTSLVKQQGPGRNIEGVGSLFGGALSGMGADEEEPKVPTEDQLVSERLNIIVSGPAGERKSVYTILDLKGSINSINRQTKTIELVTTALDAVHGLIILLQAI